MNICVETARWLLDEAERVLKTKYNMREAEIRLLKRDLLQDGTIALDQDPFRVNNRLALHSAFPDITLQRKPKEFMSVVLHEIQLWCPQIITTIAA